METKENKIDEVTQEVEFELAYSELTPYFEKAYKKFQKKVEIPGFRKGKAPLNILKLKYSSLIEQSSLEDIANEVFRSYLTGNNITPVSEGQLSDISYEHGGHLHFKVKYEILPNIKLKKYKGIEITKTTRNIDDSMIDDEINYLRHRHATYESCEETNGSEFIIHTDLQELDEKGLEIIGKRHKNIEFYLNNKDLPKDLRKQLENIHVGEERIISIPSDNGNAKKYKAHCTKIQKINLPQTDQEFFRKVYSENTPETLEKFRNKIKEDLDSFYKNLEERELKNNIISELIRVNDISVPNSIINKILDSYIEEIRNQNSRRTLPEDFNEEEYRRTKRTDAILEAKWYLIRDKIIELEKIEVNEDDINQVIRNDSQKLNIPEEKLKSLYKESNEIKHRILDEKLMKFLIENSLVHEVEETKKDDTILS